MRMASVGKGLAYTASISTTVRLCPAMPKNSSSLSAALTMRRSGLRTFLRARKERAGLAVDGVGVGHAGRQPELVTQIHCFLNVTVPPLS
ncbi:hypothetical protein HPP92_009677 [Vanilla planifolia]|uniref:Uncharacterized protein n=1 Tax=Vanilla planifolia TaxID=51239 RepID=A0A835RFS8_VANPL|nr:hypothetical protein HPP92_009677 [Vanilla planifolia]